MDRELTFEPFDCDNHYYESEDAFTRHVPEEMQARVVQWAEVGGRKYHVVGGKLSKAVTNPTWDPIAKPGALHKYFRGNPEGKNPMEYLKDREPLPAAYIDRDARLKVIESQNLEAIWLFPTLGVLYEELLKDDIPAVVALMRGFNRWIEEDWGFDYKEKIFASPYISLVDLEQAVSELEWCLEKGARTIVMRPAPIWAEGGQLSPGDPVFDPFWARVNEAGVTTVIHAGDSGYSSQGYAEDAFGSSMTGRYRPSIKAFSIERAAHDWLITMSMERMYTRFPNLRIASVENGADYLDMLFRKLKQQAMKSPTWFDEDPVELFREHVWMNPFWEDNVYEVIELMGADHVIFGSDWPHIEGMPTPLDYLEEVEDLTDDDLQLVMRDNTRYLNTPRVS
ncbi:MAG: amidohydrolase family protein [Acidimicrobiales bacterium]|jgi:predicted TIM-barrel fold metal-dependent hydrolase|nr:amidohydrolase family protein [Acidimicrobiales bacterium]MDP6895050.1 amidohydrolase family protein [Acidimicrobiales bacterium]HJM37920.1 amidohydrolase family protein [Acidimicrobiales bacterium]|tara:strand:- start:3222 stop:4406 length:1185 start_codon:yes stop_codon:yes gene_type:complete